MALKKLSRRSSAFALAIPLPRLMLATIAIIIPLTSRAQKVDNSLHKINDTLKLSEVAITNHVAVKISKDTISYTVDSFNKNPEATAEDVLKRIPGIEVAFDGTITVHGKSVAKLFMNGKEFTADDLRTITKNMPAEVLDRIQFADYYDEDAVFTGIKPNADKKIINLQFKKKYKGGIYGRGIAGYGTADRYQAGLFFNYLTDSLRITGIGNANNTGISDATRDGTDNTKAGARPQNGVNTKQVGNINFSYEPGKKLKLNGSYDVDNSDNLLQQSIYRTTYLPADSLLLRAQTTLQTANTLQHRLGLRSSYKITERNTLQLDAGAFYRKATSDNNSADTTAYETRGNTSFRRQANTYSNVLGTGFNANGIYRKKFRKEHRTLSVFANAAFSTDDGSGNNTNLNQYYNPLLVNNTAFTNTNNKNGLTYGAGFRYTEPFGKRHLLSLSYAYNYTGSKTDKLVYLDSNGVAIKDTVQSLGYYSRNVENPLGFIYQYTAGKITASAGIDLRAYKRHNETVELKNTVLDQEGINYAPTFSARYDAGNGKSINLSYSGAINTPDIKQLQPIPDYTDSLNIFIGNPELRPEVSHNASASYSYYNAKTQHIVLLQLRAGETINKIINKTDINASRKITTPVNANGNYNLGILLSYTAPVFTKKLKATLVANGSMANNISYTNGQELNIRNPNLQPSVKLVYLVDKWYEADLYYSYRYGNVHNTSLGNTVLQVHSLEHSGTFSLPWKIQITYYINYVLNKGLTNNYRQDFLLANATLDRSFKRPKGLTIKMQAFDIFNKYPTVTRNIGDNYYEDRSVNRVGSYFMFSLVYKFNYHIM